MNKTQIKNAVLAFDFQPSPQHPCLLFDGGLRAEIMRRAGKRAGYIDRLEVNARKLLATPATPAGALYYSPKASEALKVAEAYLLTGSDDFAAWARERVCALSKVESWEHPLDRGAACGHVETNTAAAIALACDCLGDALPAAERQTIAASVRRLCLIRYLAAVRDRVEWWSKPECVSNWKIMCHGESGLAACAFYEFIPEAREAIALAAEGVLETLDQVPADGDWEEGVGYWLGTLYMGLRFAAALRRMSGDAINLFEHPILKITGDFAMMLTSPGGQIFNFSDNGLTLGDYSSECLMMLAREQNRPDWLKIARLYPTDSVHYLALDDDAVPSAEPSRTAAHFRKTGIVALRTGWKADDAFLAFKCGPVTSGHAHLDVGSFVVAGGGKNLIRDEGCWPYAAFTFDWGAMRWNIDNTATIGHNLPLVDGRGQTYAAECSGHITRFEHGAGWDLVAGELAATYSGLLKQFTRTLCLIHPDIIIIHDRILCEGERRLEWLIHPEGTCRTEGDATVIENEGARLVIIPFLPRRDGEYNGWRVSDVKRETTYLNYDAQKPTTQAIRYRSFAPQHGAGHFEFLFGMRLNRPASGHGFKFEIGPKTWQLKIAECNLAVTMEDDLFNLIPGNCSGR